jgi:hypothetical protein
LVGPFKKAKCGFTHIFISVDKFTKWIEVKPVASITAAKAVEFIKEIMYMFGVPNNIITDNKTQFIARELKDFCAYSSIKINYASVSHPQSNGQVESSNGMILQVLKPRIFNRLKPYARKWEKSCRQFLGSFVPPQVVLQATHCFLYFTNPRQCYPPKWSTSHSACSISVKSSQTTPESMI